MADNDRPMPCGYYTIQERCMKEDGHEGPHGMQPWPEKVTKPKDLTRYHRWLKL